MRKMILGCLGVVAAVAVIQLAQADVKAGVYEECSPCEFVSCNPCDAACDPCDAICDTGCGKKSLFFLGGHIETGIYVNEYGRKNSYENRLWDGNGPDWDSGNTGLMKNVHNSDFQANQIYIFGGKKLSKRGWDWGGEVGVMYGTDARFVQSRGLEYGAGRGAWNDGDYYTAIAQAYAEVGYNNVSVKAGKFLNPMGHNSVISTDRFFYSLSDAFGLMPVTQSGVLATWDVNKKLSVFGGWTSGTGTFETGVWGRGFSSEGDSFFNSSDNNAFLGGVRYALNKRVSLGYTVMFGTDKTAEWKDNSVVIGNWNELGNDRDYFIQSFVVDVKLNKKWDYTFEWTLRNEKWDNAEVFVNGPNDFFGDAYRDFWGGYGINQELVYKYNKKWSFGFRAEWVHSYYSYDWAEFDQAGVYDDGHESNGLDKYSFVLGANWSPRSWIMVRPELRYDKFDGRVDRYPEKGNGNLRNKQLSGGVSAIVKF